MTTRVCDQQTESSTATWFPLPRTHIRLAHLAFAHTESLPINVAETNRRNIQIRLANGAGCGCSSGRSSRWGIGATHDSDQESESWVAGMDWIALDSRQSMIGRNCNGTPTEFELASPKTLGSPIDNCRRQRFNAQELFHELFLSLQPLDFTMITTPTVALPLLVIVLSQTLVRLTCTMPRESDSDAIRYALGAIPGNAPSLRTLRVDSYGSSSGFELSDHQMPYLHALSLGFKTASLCQQFAPVDATAALTSPKLEFTDNSDVVFHKTILRSFLCCSA